MRSVTFTQLLRETLAAELRRDPSVFLMGEDIGVYGGSFGVTRGLIDEFGPERVLDTPLDETTIAGLTVGMASQGMKPVAEAQFDGFMYPMVDFIVCHAARMRYRTRGRLTCPMVLRVPWGGGIRAPEHHSEANEAIFTNVPGLRVVMPSSPQRAYGLLLAAIRDPDPVIYMEPKRIYRQYKEEVPDDGEALPVDGCYVLRDGSDITLVTWGAQVKETLEAADALAKDGISAEVIDVATLTPLDFPTIAESVAKTGRCVIVHEAAKTAGFGAEIAARVAEIEIELMALEITNLRVLSAEKSGKNSLDIAGLLKIKGSEIQQRYSELMMLAAGPERIVCTGNSSDCVMSKVPPSAFRI